MRSARLARIRRLGGRLSAGVALAIPLLSASTPGAWAEEAEVEIVRGGEICRQTFDSAGGARAHGGAECSGEAAPPGPAPDAMEEAMALPLPAGSEAAKAIGSAPHPAGPQRIDIWIHHLREPVDGVIFLHRLGSPARDGRMRRALHSPSRSIGHRGP